MSDINTIGDFFEYYESYHTTREFFDMLKESSEIELLGVSRGIKSIYESYDNIDQLYEEKVSEFGDKVKTLAKKFKDLLVRVLEKLLNFITKGRYSQNMKNLNDTLSKCKEDNAALEAKIKTLNENKSKLEDMVSQLESTITKLSSVRQKENADNDRKLNTLKWAHRDVAEKIVRKLNISQEDRNTIMNTIKTINDDNGVYVKAAVSGMDMFEISATLHQLCEEGYNPRAIQKLKRIIPSNMSDDDSLNMRVDVEVDPAWLNLFKKHLTENEKKYNEDTASRLEEDSVKVINDAQRILRTFIKSATERYADLTKMTGELDKFFAFAS